MLSVVCYAVRSRDDHRPTPPVSAQCAAIRSSFHIRLVPRAKDCPRAVKPPYPAKIAVRAVSVCKLLIFHFRKTVAAINRSVVNGLERKLCFFSAVCTGCGVHFSLRFACIPSCITASFASLRLVLEAFFRIEFLLARGEYEFVAAVFANQCFVLIHFATSLCMDNFTCPRTDLHRHL